MPTPTNFKDCKTNGHKNVDSCNIGVSGDNNDDGDDGGNGNEYDADDEDVNGDDDDGDGFIIDISGDNNDDDDDDGGGGDDGDQDVINDNDDVDDDGDDDADDHVVNADDEEGHRQARLALPRLALPPAENLACLPGSSSSNCSTDCHFPSQDHFVSNYVQKV